MSRSRAWRRAYLTVVRLPRRAVRRWRSSLQLRVTTTTLVLGVVAVALIGTYLSERTRDSLFDQRVAEVLDESARATVDAQQSFDSSTATTGAELSELFRRVIGVSQMVGSAGREMFVLRTDTAPPPVLVAEYSTRPALRELISPELRDETVAAQGGQRWQSVPVPALDDDGGQAAPGVMVGSTVVVPVVGQYEMYFLFPLAAEQEVLGDIQRTLALGAASLLALLGLLTWSVTRQTVHPVRRAARVAERLADGLLAERMTVTGQDEMATLARSFNEMAESLQDQIGRMEQLGAMQRRFVSDVSHELRTPMTTVRMAGELLYAAREDFPPELRRSAELLAMQLDRFEELLADLLEISRFDAGAAQLEAERRDLRDVLHVAVEAVAPLAERRGSWLRVESPERPAVADVDPRRVERILRNLLVNAIEHADGTAVEATLAADASAVAITVRDHGVGMTPEQAAHVFDRFWRADKARTRATGGTGLGLAIALEDAHLHGGWLEVWGRPARGANFRLTLPRRAGIQLAGSPLALEPVDPPAPEPVESRADVASGPSDPAALPDLDRLEAR